MHAGKDAVLKRLQCVEGHLSGIRKMVEEDTCCVAVLRQTYAVRKAIEKLEALILEDHLHQGMSESIKDGQEDGVVGELVQLYTVAGNR
jgi:CsoR family transcriptional regulator, copper-sensing transcriptional repressor